MGARFSRLRLFFFCVLKWINCRAKPKRRALLVGISYRRSPYDEKTGLLWDVLGGTHRDVKRFRELLIGAYSWLHLADVTSPGIDSFS